MTNEISNRELDLVTGGMDPNYKRCEHGTTAGGPAGTYPSYANCSVTIGELIGAFKGGISQGSGGKPK